MKWDKSIINQAKVKNFSYFRSDSANNQLIASKEKAKNVFVTNI
jgi:hypothetical protein